MKFSGDDSGPSSPRPERRLWLDSRWRQVHPGSADESCVEAAGKITAATLVQVATQDDVTPVKVAMKAAKRIPGAEIRTYDCSHFEPYLDPHFDGVVGDQIDFLTRTLIP
jgi:pimeloyl-ACP methyl ester carboxylesterase